MSSGPAAREIATREPAARSGRSRSPPVPSGPYGTRHAGCPWCWCPAAARLSAAARAGGLEWCLRFGCLRARPPARSPHASLRLGVVDLEARPCPPGPTAPATLAVHGVGARPPRACRPQLELVAWSGACVSGAFGPGRPRDRHTRACGSEWSISKPARALRALRHPPHWLPVVLVPGQALPHQNPGVRP